MTVNAATLAAADRESAEAITPSAAKKLRASWKLTPNESPRNFPLPAKVRIPRTSPSLEMTGEPLMPSTAVMSVAKSQRHPS